MKNTIKKLLESPILEDFLLGLELRYREEGIAFLDNYLHDPKKVGVAGLHTRMDFNLHESLENQLYIKLKSSIPCIVIEDIHIIIHKNCINAAKINLRMGYGAWDKYNIEKMTFHEINPIYPW